MISTDDSIVFGAKYLIEFDSASDWRIAEAFSRATNSSAPDDRI